VVDRVRSVIRPFFDKQLYVNIKRLLLFILFVRFSFDLPSSFIYRFALAVGHFLLSFLVGDRPFFFYRFLLAVGHFIV